MIRGRIHNRYQAFLVHLITSAIIAILVLALVFWVWYPGHLSVATGVIDIFFLVLAVDVSLGPLLTLVVFNPGKKELRRDLLIICALQVAALAYGIYTVGVVRPVYVVFAVDRFELVYANELTTDDLVQAPRKEFNALPFFGPKWVAAQLPEDPEKRNELLFQAIDKGKDLAQMPRYYLPYHEYKDLIIEEAQPLTNLEPYNASNAEGYSELISKYGENNAEVGYLPLVANATDLVVVIDKSNGNVLETALLQPW